MLYFFSPPVLLLLCSTAALVHGQYGHFRPYPAMAMDHGFSPYHPARINQETLPISQAEFAQLVAESMATSNGPHHHHPPNTDADYEGPSHAMRDAAMMRSSRGAGVSSGHHGHHGHTHAAHDDHHHAHPPHYHHSHAAHHQYQPEEAYRPQAPQPHAHAHAHAHHQEQSEADHDDTDARGGYQRAPVYENSYHNDHDEEGDELDQANVGPTATYGGRVGSTGAEVVGTSDGSGSDGPAYGVDNNYDHPHHLHHQAEHSHHQHSHGGHGHHPQSISAHHGGHHGGHHHHHPQHQHQPQQQNLEDVEESRVNQQQTLASAVSPTLHYVPVHAGNLPLSFV